MLQTRNMAGSISKVPLTILTIVSTVNELQKDFLALNNLGKIIWYE